MTKWLSQSHFPATRADGLARLQTFLPIAGAHYASHRNSDPGPGQRGDTSMLSPYVRRRMVSEHEVVATVLEHVGPNRADKFIQEVLWRTYWKGWLEARPEVWLRFLQERDRVSITSSLAKALADAEAGRTGIEGFDDWRAIWSRRAGCIVTRECGSHRSDFHAALAWELGADFFLRHLVDADPASNALSWRWVAGLQTKGKTYLATGQNIARYTDGRFERKGLATRAEALHESSSVPVSKVNHRSEVPGRPALLLVTDEDLSPEETREFINRFLACALRARVSKATFAAFRTTDAMDCHRLDHHRAARFCRDRLRPQQLLRRWSASTSSSCGNKAQSWAELKRSL